MKLSAIQKCMISPEICVSICEIARTCEKTYLTIAMRKYCCQKGHINRIYKYGTIVESSGRLSFSVRHIRLRSHNNDIARSRFTDPLLILSATSSFIPQMIYSYTHTYSSVPRTQTMWSHMVYDAQQSTQRIHPIHPIDGIYNLGQQLWKHTHTQMQLVIQTKSCPGIHTNKYLFVGLWTTTTRMCAPASAKEIYFPERWTALRIGANANSATYTGKKHTERMKNEITKNHFSMLYARSTGGKRKWNDQLIHRCRMRTETYKMENHSIICREENCYGFI